jgi:hypothetical protein
MNYESEVIVGTIPTYIHVVEIDTEFKVVAIFRNTVTNERLYVVEDESDYMLIAKVGDENIIQLAWPTEIISLLKLS